MSPAVPIAVAPLPLNEKRVVIHPRSGVPSQLESFLSPDGRERVGVINSGVTIVIEGISGLGTVEISTDRLVIWTTADLESLSGGVAGSDAGAVPLEFYLEGNVVFRQGERRIQAAAMYYNVPLEQGLILNAELLAPIPDYQGLVRLKSAVLQQVDASRFQAFNAAVTTSRLGVPRYWFQTQNLSFTDTTPGGIGGMVDGDPATPLVPGAVPVGERRLTSRNNIVYMAGLPVFYWPVLSTDLTRPTTYINRVRLGRDRVFGQQFGIGLDLIQVFGLSSRFPRTDWNLSLDYLSKRGFGVGTDVRYEADRILGFEGPASGFLDAWGLDDDGFDNLGRDRPMLIPEANPRGRVLGQHRQYLANGWQVSAEIGPISDRNFLEEFYEREWDQEKDELTGVELKRLMGNSSFNIWGYAQVNDFFTQTSWLPRMDYFTLGQPLLGDHVTWLGHSQVAYAKMKASPTPKDPNDAFNFNPQMWEVNREGLRTGARQELDFPFQASAVRVVPYVLGEVMYWGETINDDNVTRLFGQTGIRASLPMWNLDPNVQSVLFNLNGLAHKVVFESEFFYADANQNVDSFPLFDQLDDDSTEDFRRRIPDTTFGGAPFVDNFVPIQFDERTFALRYGMQSWITAPSAEIVDDLMVARMGVRQRWQTKRGVPGRFRIVDWMTLDMGASLYPNPDRDNFGSAVGLINYDWRWHLGDRLTLASDGLADVFGDAFRTVNLGGYISRPERGSLYLGVRSLEGPISATLLNAALNYRMSPKWIGTLGTSVDLGPTGGSGQIVEVTRIGESFLVSLGANFDQGRDNLGFGIAIEPRFFKPSFRGRVGGIPIPPAGAFGLE